MERIIRKCFYPTFSKRNEIEMETTTMEDENNQKRLCYLTKNLPWLSLFSSSFQSIYRPK